MLILLFVNVGNSETDARDSIVVLTHIAWATIVTSASMVSYDLQVRVWLCSSRFFVGWTKMFIKYNTSIHL